MMQNPILNLMAECFVRSSLIATGVGALLFLWRVRNARVRHTVWAGVVVWMLALPIWTAWGPRAAVRLTNAAAAPTLSKPAAAQFISSRTQPKPLPVVWTWQSSLAAIYLAGFCVLLSRLVIGAVRARVLFQRAERREGRLTSDSCSVPVTVGWLHPRVILPSAWQRWSKAQLDAVLTHENEHVRRRDPLVQSLALVNRAAFWFHPLAWWIERQLSVLAEEACDAAVLARGHDPFEYSEYLMEMARAMQQTGARLNFAGLTMPGASLPRRIRRILVDAPAPRLSHARAACIAVACTAVSTVFTAGAVDSSHAVPNTQILGKLPPVVVLPTTVPTPTIEPARPRARKKVLLAQAQTAPARPSASDGGSLTGTVEDATGGRVPQCTVTVRDQTGATVATASTNPSGVYRFASIPSGPYSLDYSARGFALRTIQVQIAPGQQSRVDAALDLGQIRQTVEVAAPKPAAGVAPSAAQPAPNTNPIVVGGRVEAARLLKNTRPVYPPELQQQGIEGTVRLRARISSEGVPVNVHVLNDDEVDPRMAQAAVDAVRQWRYQPSKLDGEPIEVTTTIDVAFRLAN
jgi:TonB family protein